MKHQITDVIVMWPRLRSAYPRDHSHAGQTHAWVWDDAQEHSIPVAVSHKDAAYEVKLLLTKDQAKGLAEVIRKVANTSAKTAGKIKAEDLTSAKLFKKEDNLFQKMAKKKTWGESGKEVAQYSLDGSKLPADFELTSESKVHINLWIEGWSRGSNAGIRVIPESLMVVDLAERKERKAPAEPTEHPFKDLMQANGSPKVAHPFAEQLGLDETPAPAPATRPSDDFDDEIPF